MAYPEGPEGEQGQHGQHGVSPADPTDPTDPSDPTDRPSGDLADAPDLPDHAGPPVAWPPGWYDDPGFPGRPRWWDGNAWAPPGPPPGMQGYGRGFTAPPNLPDEKSNAGRARAALLVGAGAQGVAMVANVIYFNEFGDVFRETLRTASTRPRGTRVDPMAGLSSTALAANAIGQIASLVVLVVGILFLVWFHRALTNAQALGLPLRRSPGWGVAGFLIPIVNLWFPYQSACDLFPPEHPDRKLVGRWWAYYLGAGFAAMAALIGTFFSVVVGAAFGVVVVGLYVAAALAGREMIERVLQVHGELAGPLANLSPAPSSVPGQQAPFAPDPWNPPPPKDPWAQS